MLFVFNRLMVSQAECRRFDPGLPLHFPSRRLIRDTRCAARRLGPGMPVALAVFDRFQLIPPPVENAPLNAYSGSRIVMPGSHSY
jgi:hypothetical protein